VAEATRALHLPQLATLVGAPAVPGDSMECADFHCHDAFPRKLPKGAKCLGGSCLTTCCEDTARSTKASIWKAPDATDRTASVETTVTTTNAFQAALAKEKTMREKIDAWARRNDKLAEASGAIEAPMSSDGFSVAFEVTYDVKSFKQAQDVLTSPFEALALHARSVDDDSRGLFGKLRRAQKGEIVLRAKGVNTKGFLCEVSSGDLVAPGKYELSVSLNSARCCLQVRPFASVLAKLGEAYQEDGERLFADAECQQRDLATKYTQLRPLTHVNLANNAHAQASGFKQTKGSATMSFKVLNVERQAFSGEIEAQLVQAVKKAVLFSTSGDGEVVASSITVALQDSYHAEAPVSDEALETTRSERPQIRWERDTAGRAKRRQKAKAMLDKLMNWGEKDSVKEGDDSVPPAEEGGRRLHEEAALWQRLQRAGAQGVGPATEVRLTVHDCGDCDAVNKGLEAPSTVAAIEASIKPVVKDLGQDAGGVVGASVPGDARRCAGVQCPSAMRRLTKNFCHGGGDCIDQCCAPLTCAAAPCEDPLVRNPLHKHKRCHNETDCAETCCLVRCAKFECDKEAACPRDTNALLFAKVSEAEETCCNKHVDVCCSSPIASCISCRMCMSKHAYCMRQLSKWLPSLDFKGKSRRLDATAAEALLPPPGSLDDDDLSGGLDPHDPPTLSPEAWALEEAEARAFIENGGPPGNGMYEGHTAEAVRRLKEAVDREDDGKRKKLLEGMFENAKKSAAYLLNNPPRQVNKKVSTEEKAKQVKWKDMWNKVVLQAKARNEMHVAGCEPGPVLSCCTYALSSMFLLHRQFRCNAKKVNTVKVLTDTTHAVSCGDDGLCWVWKIHSGYPRMVFPDHTGPVYTASVSTDSLFIISGGSDTFTNDTSGSAYVWDWRGGFQHNSFICKDGAFLSSAEFPAWRLVGLGCSSAYSYIWDWATNANVKLPYYARTAEEVEEALRQRVKDYKNSALTGAERLAWDEGQKKLEEIRGLARDKWPKMADRKDHIKQSMDNLFDFVHNNTYGAVNAMAYIPSNLLFVTGHQDGRVRLWSSDSGKMLMCMSGHQGPVTSVAAQPTYVQAWSGGEDGTLRLWDLRSGRQLLVLSQTYGGPIYSIAVFPGGRRVAVGSHDGYVRIYQTNNGIPLCAINTGGSPVTALAITPVTEEILAGTQDGYVRVFTHHTPIW